MFEYSLFNAMDGSLATLDATAFDQSLVLNILFQDKVLVYDGTFFTCHNLIDHLKKRPGYQSLFEVACGRGLIVPAIRDPKIQSLEESARSLRLQSPGYQLPEAEKYRDRIIYAVDRSIAAGTTRPFYWPANTRPLGEGYEEVVRKLLYQDRPPIYIEQSIERTLYFQDLWERTRTWRTDIIDMASRRTLESGQLGLRRQEIFNELGRSLGITPGHRDVTYDDLMKICPDNLPITVFLRWLAQCHFINQARAFDVAINFPIYHLDEDCVLDSILRSPRDEAPSKEVGFRCEVTLPAIGRLSQSMPDDLIAIRLELGGEYLRSLRRWQEEANDDNLDHLKRSLKFYCEEISARYKHITPIEVEVTIDKGRVANIINAVANFVSDHNIPLLQHFTKLGTALYKARMEAKAEIEHAPRQQDLEITLPNSNDGSSNG
jgi:hypothetical protein